MGPVWTNITAALVGWKRWNCDKLALKEDYGHFFVDQR
jgi:hypothetical protein